jgi:6-phosphogluconolactonase (cycloisomerase 2 family)
MHCSANRVLKPSFSVFVLITASVAIAQTLPPPKFLYSSDGANNKVRGFFVNATTGAITANGQGSVAAHQEPTRVASDKGGYRLYAINHNSKDLSAYFINRSNGHLTPVPGSPFTIGQTPTGVTVHPSGHWVYVTTFVSTSNPAGSVYAWAVQSNGSLKPVPGSPFSTVNWAQTLAIDPQGKYLYVSSSPEVPHPGISKVDAHSISSTDGALTPLPGTPYTEPNSSSCANGANDIAINPGGNFLILPNMCEGLVVYRITRTTGTLTLIKGSPFAPPNPGFLAEGNVDGIAMDPQGLYIWITDQYCHSGCTMSTDTWKLNTTTGVPTYLESGNAGCGLLVRSDPSGKFLYEIGDTGSPICGGIGPAAAIWGFHVNRTNGVINNISGSPWKSPNSDSFYTDGLVVTP